MKTVIEMAREAGLPEIIDNANKPWSELSAFAELVRADERDRAMRENAYVLAEREAMMQLFTDPENQPTQHGTVTVEYMQREVAAEREACAELIESRKTGANELMDAVRDMEAAAIRARGQA